MGGSLDTVTRVYTREEELKYCHSSNMYYLKYEHCVHQTTWKYHFCILH